VQEGENICFEVLEAVSGSIRRQDKTTVFRAKFSSITDKDIVAAMNSLGQPDENQSKSVDARQELDLRIGCAFTRFQTRFFQVYGSFLYTVLRIRIRDPVPF
jgi:DNA topoisomerase-3